MNVICLGLNHTSAPLELREQLTYTLPDLRAALARIGCGEGGGLPLLELAILSTCNRAELYGVTSDTVPPARAFEALRDFLAETRSITPGRFAAHLYRHENDDAVRHLCRVAAGLDSRVLGEPQILGQVVEALEVAHGQGAAGPVLSALFRRAIRAGKRARTETAISRSPATVSSVAARVAEEEFIDLPRARALILGTGEMGRLAGEALRARGVRHITLASRSLSRATEVAQGWAGRATTYEGLLAALAEADLVVAATDAPHLLITVELARQAMAQRPARPLLCIDVAVPRNIDPEVRCLPNVGYCDIDSLHERVDDSLAARQAEVPHVEAIINEEVAAFLDWQQGLEVLPVIRDLHSRAERIWQDEVEKALRRFPGLTEPEQTCIRAMAAAITHKLLHEPTRRLKAEAGNGHVTEYAAAVRHLFALND